MSDYLLYIIPGFLPLLFGIAMVAQYFKRLQEIRICTEAVTAEVVELNLLKRRNGYRHFYKIRYQWGGQHFSVEFTTTNFMGDPGEETVIYIDPNQPDKYRLVYPPVQLGGNFAIGLSFVIIGLIWLFAGAVDVYQLTRIPVSIPPLPTP